jgi:hypothetical protein
MHQSFQNEIAYHIEDAPLNPRDSFEKNIAIDRKLFDIAGSEVGTQHMLGPLRSNTLPNEPSPTARNNRTSKKGDFGGLIEATVSEATSDMR